MANIDYSTGPRLAAEGTHRVYTKPTWAAAWIEQPNLKCLECHWAAAPQMNTAVLLWDVGSIILPGDSAPTAFGVWIGRGQFVRIDWVCDDTSTLIWGGFIDASSWPQEIQGQQQIVCYGLEQALAKTPIDGVVWRYDDGSSVSTRRSALPVAFGGPGGMRSEEPVTAGQQDYAFAAPNEDAPQPWSTRQAVRYLMTHHLPTNTQGVSAVPWSVQQIDQLPDWDQVYVETRNRTVYDVLTQLITPSQQLGFTVASDGSIAALRCFTHLENTLTIGSNSLQANPNRHTLTFAPDALTNAKFRDVSGGHDQVLVRGARRQSIVTLQRGESLVDDWEPADEVAYEEGASNHASYATWSSDERKSHNAAARGHVRFEKIFQRLKIDPDWNHTFDDGVNTHEVFPDRDGAGGTDFPREITINPTLPIKPGSDWSAPIDASHFDREGEGIALKVFWEHPDVADEYVDNRSVDTLQAVIGGRVDFDFTIQPTAEGRTLDLRVLGGPQHVIAESTFAGLPEDISPQLDYTNAKMTVAMSEDRFIEGCYPDPAPNADIVRRLVVDVGEAYQQIYIVPGTTIEVEIGSRTERTSTGGYLVDDSEAIQSLAEVIARSLLLTRKSVSWSSSRKISTIAVGDLVTTAGGASVISPIQSVHIAAPVAYGRPAGPALQSFETYSGNNDPIAVLQQLGGATGETVLADDLKVVPNHKQRPRRLSLQDRRRAKSGGEK